MSSAKYYVWAGGSWRELDCASGRVAGWRGRARFVFVRRGRLQVARARQVLRALAALAAARPAPVGLGPRLSQRRYVNHEVKQRRKSEQWVEPGCHHACCQCMLRHNNSVATGRPPSLALPASPTKTIDAGVQCSGRTLTTTAHVHAPPAPRPPATCNTEHTLHLSYRHTQRRDSSDDFEIKTMPRTASERRVRHNGALGRSPRKRVRAHGSSDEALATFQTETTVVRHAKEAPRNKPTNTKRAEAETASEAEFKVKIVPNERYALRTPDKSAKRKRDISESVDETSDSVVFVRDTRERAKTNTPRKARTNFAKKAKLSEVSSDSTGTEVEVTSKRMTRSAVHPGVSDTRNTRNSLKSNLIEIHSTDTNLNSPDSVKHETVKKIVYKSSRNRSRSGSEETAGGWRRGGGWLELSIPEGDVQLLRGYLERSGAGDLYRFDADDDYKRAIFYSINPIVSVERCARLERALALRFAEQLGLRSVSGASVASPRRTRRTRPGPPPAAATVVSDASDTTASGRSEPNKPSVQKLNTNGSPAASKESAHVVKTIFSKIHRTKAGRFMRTPQSKESKENVPQRANRMRDAASPPAATKHTISKRSLSGGKEYSNLEDHAIVAWVSGGGRARRVNGNQLWRQLQDQYLALTGTARSWHSLRNRYLRYILPALAALRLPAAHAARLRAAAATGELKSKRMVQRRNSIFDKEPVVRGASSRSAARAPSPAPAPTDSEDDAAAAASKRRSLRSSGVGPAAAPAAAPAPAPAPASAAVVARKASPRYSDVTRQFALRKLRSTPRDSADKSRDPAPPAPSGSRKLFNPRSQL